MLVNFCIAGTRSHVTPCPKKALAGVEACLDLYFVSCVRLNEISLSEPSIINRRVA